MDKALNTMRTLMLTVVKKASVEQLTKIVNDAFGVHENAGESQQNRPRKKRARIRKRANGRMSRAVADDIRKRMGSLAKGSDAHIQMRDKIAREMGFSRRQVSAAVSGLARVANRKKSGAKKK